MKCWKQLLKGYSSPSILGLLAALVAANPGKAQVAIIEVPTSGNGESRALNQAGVVAGLAGTTNGEQHAFTFTNGLMQDLGTLGGQFSQAWHLNLLGDVVGQSSITDDLEEHAFLLHNGQLQDLGTLGGSSSTAAAVNDSGQVAGSAYIAGDEWRAFLWSNGNMMNLGTLGGSYSVAVSLNATGQVAGDSYTVGDAALHAFLYSQGTMVDLETLGGLQSTATALNGAGMVAGDSETETFETHAFLYHAGQMHDLGTLGGSFSMAAAINEAGQVIGDSAITDDADVRGFIYDNGVMTDLGSFGGGSSSAWGLNNHGQVVGYATDVNGMMAAFVWEDGVMVDLNTLLPPNSGWQLLAARHINDAGQIVGFGFLDGRFTEFFLTLASSNHDPVAHAGPDATVECSSAALLDASASTDPDGDALTYEWSENGVVLGGGVQLSVSLALGTHNVHLVVTDSHGATGQDDVVITVADRTAPVVTCPVSASLSAGRNCRASVPDLRTRVVATDNCTASTDLARTQTPAAGTVVGLGTHQVTVTVTDGAGNSSSCVTSVVVADTTPPVVVCPEPVVLAAQANCEAVLPDFLASLRASDNCSSELVRSQTPPAGTHLRVGAHVVVLAVSDAAGNRSECSVVVRVTDAVAPVISAISVTPDVLNPPNKAMVPVQVQVVATDTCDSSLRSRIVSITSSEPVTGPGDNTSPDFRVTGPLTAELRAERTSKDGRVYTITVECRDSSGNTTSGVVFVTVPKGKDKDNGLLAQLFRINQKKAVKVAK